MRESGTTGGGARELEVEGRMRVQVSDAAVQAVQAVAALEQGLRDPTHASRLPLTCCALGQNSPRSLIPSPIPSPSSALF